MVHAVGASLLAGRIVHALGLLLQTLAGMAQAAGQAVQAHGVAVQAITHAQYQPLLQAVQPLLQIGTARRKQLCRRGRRRGAHIGDEVADRHIGLMADGADDGRDTGGHGAGHVEGGIVAWVAFWAFYGHGFSSENLASVGSFGLAYMSVVLLEPLIERLKASGKLRLADLAELNPEYDIDNRTAKVAARLIHLLSL